MTSEQRKALLEMVGAILAVSYCPWDIRARAVELEEKISAISGMARRMGFRIH